MIELRLLGRPTIAIMNKFKKVFELYKNEKTPFIILFCDFSEFEIPIGHHFRYIEIDKKRLLLKGLIILKSISQEHAILFESIPVGWKTICKFEILETADIDVFNILPEINQWSESKMVFTLA